jgi:hypothetical protein
MSDLLDYRASRITGRDESGRRDSGIPVDNAGMRAVSKKVAANARRREQRTRSLRVP